jgi:nitronate monooxygenase
MSTFLEALGVELPIIQSPMAGSQASALAIAVSNAGGLGSLPTAVLSSDQLRAELTAMRAGTARPFNVNFFCHQVPTADPNVETAWRRALRPFYDELHLNPDHIPDGPSRRPFDDEALAILAEFRPAVVSFHFGLPEPRLVAAVKALGAVVMSSATTVDEATWLEAHGADVIIAQGVEAGGHRGMFLTRDLATQQETLALLPEVVAAVKVPVVAAGGIADAEAVRMAQMLGATAVQVGTAYLLCPEATTTRIHRQALASDAAQYTALTNLFTGRPARGIVNRLMDTLGPMSHFPPAFPLAATAVAPLRAAAEAAGSSDFSPLWAGEQASRCQDIPAGELTRALAGV